MSSETKSLLHRAIVRHDVARALELIATGRYTELRWRGLTPLVLAVDESLNALVDALLHAGANYWIRDPEDGESLLHIAARRGSTRNTSLCLDLGLYVDDRCSHGRTPLLSACASTAETDEVVEVLLKHGAAARVQESHFGTTPLIEAARLGKLWVVKTLLAHEADPDVKSLCGETALDAANVNGHLDIARMLSP
jgi:ankyrin repeat protein